MASVEEPLLQAERPALAPITPLITAISTATIGSAFEANLMKAMTLSPNPAPNSPGSESSGTTISENDIDIPEKRFDELNSGQAAVRKRTSYKVKTAPLVIENTDPESIPLLKTEVNSDIPKDTKPAHYYWEIHGKRYDLTPFMDKHPGGRTAMDIGRGRDATVLFESYHSLASSRPYDLLKKFYVDDNCQFTPDTPEAIWTNGTPFYDDLKEEGKKFFAGKTHKSTWSAWLKLWVMFTAFLASGYKWYYGDWSSILLVPFFYWVSCSSMMHDGAHFSLSKRPWINMVLSYFGSFHISITTWLHQHTIGHHCRTNQDGDPDLYHFTDTYRLTEQSRHKGIFHWWRKLIGLMLITSTVGPAILRDAEYITTRKFNGVVDLFQMSRWFIFRHMIGRMLIVAITLSPYYRFALVKATVFALAPYFIHGAIFWCFSQVSHINEECFHNQKKIDTQEWAITQVESSIDYSCDSTLWHFLSVALNTQVVHHLFPQVHPCHYQKLIPIVEKVCRKHGVKYNKDNTFWTLLPGVMRFIGIMNDSGSNIGYREGKSKDRKTD